MALSLVDVGTTANDGTGDPLRTAFQTVNTALTLLDDFASAANTDGNIMVGTGAGWAAESGDTARTSLGLGTTDVVQFNTVHVGTTETQYSGHFLDGDGLGVCTQVSDSASGAVTGFYLKTRTGGSANAKSAVLAEGNGGSWGLNRMHLAVRHLSDTTRPQVSDAVVTITNDSSDGKRVGIDEVAPDYNLDVNGTFGFTPGSSVTPIDNGDIVFEATSNTTFTVKLKGSDGVVRSGTITLA